MTEGVTGKLNGPGNVSPSVLRRDSAPLCNYQSNCEVIRAILKLQTGPQRRQEHNLVLSIKSSFQKLLGALCSSPSYKSEGCDGFSSPKSGGSSLGLVQVHEASSTNRSLPTSSSIKTRCQHVIDVPRPACLLVAPVCSCTLTLRHCHTPVKPHHRAQDVSLLPFVPGGISSPRIPLAKQSHLFLSAPRLCVPGAALERAGVGGQPWCHSLFPTQGTASLLPFPGLALAQQLCAPLS